eukprot:COSAG01_NODE_11731_length_1870_cov_7.682101_3_plen_82_part_00
MFQNGSVGTVVMNWNIHIERHGADTTESECVHRNRNWNGFRQQEIIRPSMTFSPSSGWPVNCQDKHGRHTVVRIQVAKEQL